MTCSTATLPPTPSRKWVADITYSDALSGWVYTAFITDLYSKAIVGWQVADHLRTDLALDTLEMALWARGDRLDGQLVHHSEPGQYTSKEFADFCAENGVARSMGRRATRYDNAVSESFFATYKKELIHTRPWNTVAEVRQQTFLWIEGYYNRKRRHSTIDYFTPNEYELG